MNFDDITLQISIVSKQFSFHNSSDVVESIQHAITIFIQWLQEIASSIHLEIPLSANSASISYLLRILIYLLGAASLIGIAYLLYRSFRPKSSSMASTVTVHTELPNYAGWQKQASAFAQNKDWKNACRALYLSGLQLLSEKKIIAFVPTHTNYEYFYLLNSRKLLQHSFRQLVNIIEKTWFGNYPAQETDYQLCIELLHNIANTIDNEPT